MDHIPNNMRMAAAKMSNYSRNRFRLETTSNDSAKAGRIITVNLPEGGAICDLKSFKMHMDVATNSATVGSATVYGRLPADASSLISRVEVYLNGVQLQQGAAEYNTICRILKIGRSSRDKDGSTDRALSHGAISSWRAVFLLVPGAPSTHARHSRGNGRREQAAADWVSRSSLLQTSA